jgi:hypothetical protein
VTDQPITDADLWAWMDQANPIPAPVPWRAPIRGAVFLCCLWAVAVTAGAALACFVL